MCIIVTRGHIEDVYDLAWSPNGSQLISGSVDNSVIVWDAVKGISFLSPTFPFSPFLMLLTYFIGDKLKILKDHRQYVQGVCWDPCGAYIASYSSDRTCRIYTTNNYRCCYNVNKITLPNTSKTEDSGQVCLKNYIHVHGKEGGREGRREGGGTGGREDGRKEGRKGGRGRGGREQKGRGGKGIKGKEDL